MPVADAIVAGAGLIGLAIAWRARQAGLTVTVVDSRPGQGASRTAAGMLGPITEVHHGEEPLLRLNLASAAMYPGFVDELEAASGRQAGYRSCGTVEIALDNDDNAALEERFGFARRLGLDVSRLRARECRECEPLLAPSVRGGILVDSDHQVDPRALAGALLTALDGGGQAVRSGRVVELLHERSRVVGARLESGETLSAPAVVIAAGSWSAGVRGVIGQPVPPIRPVKGQLLHLVSREPEPFLERTVRGLVQGLPVYLVPRAGGRVIVGATAEERGFDQRVTVDAVYTLLRDARALVPGITELELDEISVGLRPASPDNAPVIGPHDGLEGLIWATGHNRNGVLLTPITAAAVAALLTGGELPAVAPFGPGRFSLAGVR